MTQKFRARGYPLPLLEQSKITTNRPKIDTNSRIPFVHSFHPFMYRLHRTIRSNWPILANAYPNVREFQNPFLPCFKRAPNLRDNLVKADIDTNITTRQRFLGTPREGTFPCLRCVQCNNVQKGGSIRHPRSGKEFKIRGYFTCDSTYVIYVIKCPCGLLYVGETSQSIRDRVSKHKSTIRCQNLLLPLPYHFHALKHNISQLRFQVLEHVPMQRRGGDRILMLKKREAYWIHTLDTLSPRGLNRDYELSAFNQRLKDLSMNVAACDWSRDAHVTARATNHKPRHHRKVLQAFILRKEGSRLQPGRVRG
ncbi:unnamed protein product [Ranitomeya imitator]|uniref:GIY-YIG domain-containing protein n=1 Tax=Ranitomeya imitator TaxID=111125 RepID=A0ABN9M0U1_9NEOB|nr:unnamed protein product [Ranitomeya imitator]